MAQSGLKHKAQKALKTWTILSIAAVAAIPLLVLSLTKVIPGGWLIAAPCCAFLLFAFYGLPLGWVSVATTIYLRNIWCAIVEDGITDVDELAASFGRRPRTMKLAVRTLLSRGYLRGFKLHTEGTSLARTQIEKPQKGRCEYCGSPLPPDSRRCEYCGGTVVL